MHWLIPAVSHSLSGLLALQQQSIGITGVLLSLGLAASQWIHLWGAFYGLFVLVFFVQIGVAARARDVEPSVRARGALRLLSIAVIPAVLVPLHQYYLGLRLATVPWFHIRRAPAGCLPIPSRTLTQPFNYGLIDALGNQLPYGVVTSYAVAMAHTLSSSYRGKGSGGTPEGPEVMAAAVGAFVVASIAAYGLPLCGADDRDGSHQVATHVDRSVDWNERTAMSWSTEAKYGWFVIPLTAVGAAGALLTGALASKSRSSKANSPMSSKPDGPITVKRGPVVPSEKAAAQVGLSSHSSDGSSGNARSGQDGGEVANSLANALLTGSVIGCMALWSWTGPRVLQEATLPGVDMFLDAAS